MNYLSPINACLEQLWADSFAGFTLLNAQFQCITHRGCQNKFCSQIRRIGSLNEECENCDRIALMSRTDHEYDCPWGLKESVLHIPLKDGTVHAIVGKYRRPNDERATERLHDAIRSHKLNETELLAAYRARPALTRLQSERVCRTLKEDLIKLDKRLYLRSFGDPTILQTIELLHDGMNAKDLEKCFSVRYCPALYRKLGWTRRPLNDLFWDLCGEAFSEFVRERRLVFAEHQLTNTNNSIHRIAHRLCYNDAYFTAFFHRYCAISPREFRAHGFIGVPHPLRLPF